MGREVRRVPKDWQHPKNERGRYVPLFDGYAEAAREFLEVVESKGLQAAIDDCGLAPDRADYMPEWPDSERTHLMMYETTSEGTPISPAFATPEELAHWLADNGASAFGHITATYEEWLTMIGHGSAVSMACIDGKVMSGVEFEGTREK